ncbi:MAG TPA: tetratricopeptide repeat protein [Candidatus Obscuribacterales bacterium]
MAKQTERSMRDRARLFALLLASGWLGLSGAVGKESTSDSLLAASTPDSPPAASAPPLLQFTSIVAGSQGADDDKPLPLNPQPQLTRVVAGTTSSQLATERVFGTESKHEVKPTTKERNAGGTAGSDNNKRPPGNRDSAPPEKWEKRDDLSNDKFKSPPISAADEAKSQFVVVKMCEKHLRVAQLATEQKDYATAVAELKKALETTKGVAGSEPMQLTIIKSLIKVYRLQGNAHEAESYLREAIALCDAVRTAAGRTNNAATSGNAFDAGTSGNAFSAGTSGNAFDAGTACITGINGSLATTMACELPLLLEELGAYVELSGRESEAKALYERALSLTATPPLSLAAKPRCLLAIGHIAAMYAKEARAAEAEALYKRAFQERPENLSVKERLELADCLEGYAELLWETNRTADVDWALKCAFEIKRSALGEDDLELPSLLRKLARRLIAQGKYEQALTYARRAMEIDRYHKNVPPELLAPNLSTLGAVYKAMGKNAEARAMFQAALDTQMATKSGSSRELAFTLRGLASVLEDMGNAGEAEAMYRRALSALEERASGISAIAGGADSASAAMRLLEQSGRLDEAKKLRDASTVDNLFCGFDPPHAAAYLGDQWSCGRRSCVAAKSKD